MEAATLGRGSTQQGALSNLLSCSGAAYRLDSLHCSNIQGGAFPTGRSNFTMQMAQGSPGRFLSLSILTSRLRSLVNSPPSSGAGAPAPLGFEPPLPFPLGGKPPGVRSHAGPNSSSGPGPSAPCMSMGLGPPGVALMVSRSGRSARDRDWAMAAAGEPRPRAPRGSVTSSSSTSIRWSRSGASPSKHAAPCRQNSNGGNQVRYTREVPSDRDEAVFLPDRCPPLPHQGNVGVRAVTMHVHGKPRRQKCVVGCNLSSPDVPLSPVPLFP